MNNFSPCLELGPARAGVNVGQVAVAVVLGIAVSGMFLKSCLSPTAMRWFVRLIYAVYLVGVVMLVGMAVQMSLAETSNVALLPMFALYALGSEGLHFLPADTSPTPEAKTFALVEWYAGKASRLTCRPFFRGLLLGIFCLFAFAVYAVLSIATIFGVISPFLGFSAQLTSHSEAAAVVDIARYDVLATLSHAVLLCAGLTGHRHFHAFESRPWVLGIATLLFVPALAVLLSKAEQACPGQLGEPTLSLEDFEHCQAKAAGPAYALAFISMTRQVFLGVLDAVFEPPAADQRQLQHHNPDDIDAAAGGDDGLGQALLAKSRTAVAAVSSSSVARTLSTRSVRDILPLLRPLISSAPADGGSDGYPLTTAAVATAVSHVDNAAAAHRRPADAGRAAVDRSSSSGDHSHVLASAAPLLP